MLNSEKYRFSDFTISNYERLIQIAKKKFEFKSFTDYQSSQNFILWRHDVDFSMHRALKMAQIEAKHNVKANYFILLHSEFYNLFEKEISDLLKQIIDLGHHIGLHFDSHYYNIKNESELTEKLNFEKSILENLFNVPIQSFCFHIHNNFTLNANKNEYANLINAFAYKFQKEIPYCSDSNGYWRYRSLEEMLLDDSINFMQALTHPELWQDEIMSPKQRVERCANLRKEKTIKWYSDVLASNNRENVDW